MKHKLIRITLAALIAAAISAWADSVLDWNVIAAQTIFAAGRPGPSRLIHPPDVQAEQLSRTIPLHRISAKLLNDFSTSGFGSVPGQNLRSTLG